MHSITRTDGVDGSLLAYFTFEKLVLSRTSFGLIGLTGQIPNHKHLVVIRTVESLVSKNSCSFDFAGVKRNKPREISGLFAQDYHTLFVLS